MAATEAQFGKILRRVSAKLDGAHIATESGNGGMADAAVLKTVGSNPVRVRIPLSAPLLGKCAYARANRLLDLRGVAQSG